MDEERTVVAIQGAAALGDVPGLEAIAGEAELRFAADDEALARVLSGAQVLLGWNFKSSLEQAWPRADRLRWIHWCGAGVDAALFPGLARSDVTLTNSRGVFDAAMAEYALGLMLAFAKRLPETLRCQRERRWHYRHTERLAGTRALVVGAGSIGRAIARALRGAGVRVSGVGRRARAGDEDFEAIGAIGDLASLLPSADWVILVAPLTAETCGMFGAREIGWLKPTARLLNLGRGELLDEDALVAALAAGRLGGAALDVFRTEPLPADSALWDRDDVIVSPHMSGDFEGFERALVDLFVENFRRWREGAALRNVVDKGLGFVPAEPRAPGSARAVGE